MNRPELKKLAKLDAKGGGGIESNILKSAQGNEQNCPKMM